MGFPQSWTEMNEKLKQLYPDSAERGKTWKALLDLDEPEAVRCFEDDDATVKRTLDALRTSDRDKLQAMYNMLLEMRKDRSTVSIGSIDALTWQRVRVNVDLKYGDLENLQASAPKETVPAFDWDDRTEPAQSVRYMSYLDVNISINPERNGWVDAASDPQLLSFDGLETLGFNFRGTTDVLVATRAAIRNDVPNKRMLLLFELKKKVTTSAVYQASIKVLLANLHSPETKPAMMLTDLCDEWQLLWMDGSTLFQHTFTSRSQAVGFIEDFLAHRIEAGEGVHPSAVRVAKRRRIDQRMMPGAAASALIAEQMESLEGVVDPSELRQMWIVFIMQRFVNSPCAPSYRQPSEESTPSQGMDA